MRGLSRRLLAASAALVLFLGLDLALVSPGPGPSHAVEAPVERKWSQLVPPAPPGPPKSFLSGRPATPGNPASPPGSPHDGSAPPAGQPDGRWMSGPLQQGETPAPVVAALDGKRVRIGGYVVSLDFD